MAILVLGVWPSVALAQVDVTDPNLHGGEAVSGVEATAPSPYVNSQDIFLLAQGETDSLLYSNVRFYAYGLFCDVNDVNLANSGAVDVNAVGGNTTANGSVNANVYAYGIDAIGDVNNIGDILVSVLGGTANVPGSVADVRTDADAYVDAYGIDADGDVNNTAAITVTAAGGTATATSDANDTYADADADTDIDAYGIEAGGAVINTGAITVMATAGTATANLDAYSDAYAWVEGIVSEGTVTNTGDVTLTVAGGVATADEAWADAYAYGFYLDSDSVLTNTGTVRVSGDEAYEVYVDSGTTTLASIYNVTLDGDPNDASLYVADGASLALNDATLTVTSVNGETLWDTEYRLFETQGTGVVDGNFADVQAVNPDTTATYYDQGTTGSAADDTVALS